MKPTYYNEIDLYCAAWLKNLMASRQIPYGEVDTRPIQEVQPDDLKGFGQHHFFAGIGGWAVACRLVGVPDDMEIWTGSPPCQPFSTAGKQKGKEDERHLWPHFLQLIKQRSPAILFGEQVASAIAHEWWDDAADDLEAEGYATGAMVLPACSVGAPHKRDRLFFLANANQQGLERRDSGICQKRSGECSPWAGGTWIPCQVGKQRLIEPSICLLADGVRDRSPKLRAYGNAIVPQVAAEFIRAAIDFERMKP